MKTNSVQYWLYAVLNKKFGASVGIQRDRLHRHYEVNRHGFEVWSKREGAEAISAYLKEVLKHWHCQKEGAYVKRFGNKEFYINIGISTRGNGLENYNVPTVMVSIFGYNVKSE